ncbi:MAG: ABC transporter substrate-binding protein [Ilumatobacter sp.]|nr:ABC transporter substrate-binding protein [Ilumatobacter sp.]
MSRRSAAATRRRDRRSAFAAVVVLALAACGSGDGPAADTTGTATEPTEPIAAPAGDGSAAPPADTAGEPVDGTTPADTSGVDDGGGDTGDGTTGGTDADPGFAALGPPTGEPLVIGMVNTEGTPGLDFPEMRTDTDLAVDYLNAHGGMGGRPITIEHCASNGSPETSQACAQELSGKGVEFVLLGLDLFPGYDTFEASGIPVFGALPILPGDYSADALFLTGGNATTMAAMVALARDHVGASTVGIISADNPGANGSEAALTGALDKAGIAHRSVKGGDNETDAGFQGLIREANEGDPDLLVSLYSDAGCIGAMRGRVSLGIATPVVSTAICGSAEVIDVVGDDALGWYFVGVGTDLSTPAADVFGEIIEPAYGDLATASLGVGALGITQVMTLAIVANDIAEAGGAVTGEAIHERLATATDLRNFPNGTPLACGLSATYPSVCSFHFPIGEYEAGGTIRTVPGFEAVSVVDFLP